MALSRRTRLRAKTLGRNTPLLRRAGKRRRPRYTGPDRATRDLLIERDGGCVLCGCGPDGLQIHHRKPRRMGGRKAVGANAPSNLISLCLVDHAWVESARTEALEMGLLLYEHDDPRQVPVAHRRYGAVYLLDDGTVRQVPSWDGAT